MPDGKPVPGIGDAAKQGGSHAARVIRARLRARRRACRSATGTWATSPPSAAAAALIDFGWIQLTGWIGWWTWGLAHIYFLIGLKNRIFIALNWLWIYLTGYRSARLITQDMPGSASQAGDATPADAGGPQSEPASASLRA